MLLILLLLIHCYLFYTGVGAGLIFGPGLVVVNQYFEKKRGLANGVSQAGSGVGSMVLPPLILFALNNYGLEGTLLIMGGLALNLCICGMLFRPANFYLRRHCLNMQRQLGLKNAVLDGTKEVAGVVNAGLDAEDVCDATNKTFDDPIIPQDTCLRNVESPLHIDERAAEPNGERNGGQHLNPVALVHYTGKGASFKNKDTAIETDHSEKTDQHKVVISVIDIDCHPTNGDASTTAGVNDKKFRSESQPYKPPWFDFRLLTNPMFLIYAISIAISLCTYCDMFIMATPHAEDLGFSSTQATMVVSIMGVADTVGRIGFGMFADFNIIKKHHLFHASLAMTSVVLFVMPSLKTYGTYTFVCVLFSSAGSVYMSIFPTLLVESFGIERLPTIYGMVMQFVACGHLIIPASMGRYQQRHAFENMSAVSQSCKTKILYINCGMRESTICCSLKNFPIIEVLIRCSIGGSYVMHVTPLEPNVLNYIMLLHCILGW